MTTTVDVERLLTRLGIEGRKRGREWYAFCPNPEHKDSDPSWRMRDEPGSSKHALFHCYPCGFQGTAVDLVMTKLGVGYREARAWLEGAAVDQKAINAVDVQTKRPKLRFELPEEVRFAPIVNWPSMARVYYRGRKLLDEQVDRWGIGYASTGRLQHRIVIVSRDRKGVPQRYTARTYVDDVTRYYEPEPHEKANAGVMFGEQHWPPMEDRETLYVVEGAINALAIEAELGVGVHVAATAGSSLRGIYATKLSTWRRLVLLTDPDPAGDKLAAEIADAKFTSCERVRLPKGTDPANLRQMRPGELRGILASL